MKTKNTNTKIRKWIMCSLIIIIVSYTLSIFLNHSITAAKEPANHNNYFNELDNSDHNNTSNKDNTNNDDINTNKNYTDEENPNVYDDSINKNKPNDSNKSNHAGLPFNLILVNQHNPLPSSYYPENMINVFDKYGTSDVSLRDRYIIMSEDAYIACREMFKAAKANNINGIYVLSAYRDYATQEQLYNNHNSTNKTYGSYPLVAKPGQSEHQTGLAIDLEILPEYKRNKNADYGQTEQAQWFIENCWQFGFILRYPQGKEHITGIAYEPWHFRYVGKEHSMKMKNSNQCLEEYIAEYY